MQYVLIGEPEETYDVAVLLKDNALKRQGLMEHYIEPMKQLGLSNTKFIGLGLPYFGKKKPTAKQIKEYLFEELLPECKALGIKVLQCTDGNYFKVLSKKSKVEPLHGYVVPCGLEGYEDISLIYSSNYQGLFVNDTLQAKIDLANKTTVEHVLGTFEEIGTNIIHYEEYIPCNPVAIKQALDKLHQYPSLTVDTETFSLRHTKARLGTIGFAWSKHEGICIDVEHLLRTKNIGLSRNIKEVQRLLREFFETYKGNIKYHNASYDIKILIYYLWMKHLLDTEGLIKGLEVMTRDYDDTRIITYLATNSCAGNKLGLKDQAHEFAGNYAQDDIDDITLIPNQDLMRYNLVDCLSTWYVYEKHYPTMIADNQEQVYVFFKKALKNIIQMELTGMPVDLARTKEVDDQIRLIVEEHEAILENSPLMQKFILHRKTQLRDAKNASYKSDKRITIDEVKYSFNPNSNKELIALIHEYLGYEVTSVTETGQPAVGGDELKGHMKRSTDDDAKAVLNAIMKIQEGNKIRNTFLNKFLDADEGPDGWHYLFGSFNLGGTKSGRLSSSNPNL